MSTIEGNGFHDVEAARRQIRARCMEQAKFLISVKVQDEPQAVGEIVQAHHDEVLFLISSGFPLDRNTVECALKKIAIVYARRGDVTQDEITQGCKLSLQIVEALYGVVGHYCAPNSSMVGLTELRIHVSRNRARRRRSAPSNQRRPMNMPLSTFDKVRIALDRDITPADIRIGWYTLVGFIFTLLGLLAIGGGR